MGKLGLFGLPFPQEYGGMGATKYSKVARESLLGTRHGRS
jgi:alkylation response protein AidB-like acyl-CoA dehydrogenase